MLLKLTKRNGDKVERYGISPKTDYIGMFMLCRAFGSDFLSDDGKSVRLGEKPARAAIKPGGGIGGEIDGHLRKSRKQKVES